MKLGCSAILCLDLTFYLQTQILIYDLYKRIFLLLHFSKCSLSLSGSTPLTQFFYFTHQLSRHPDTFDLLSMTSKTKKKKEKYKKRELDIKGCSLAKYIKKKTKSCFTFTKIQRFNLQFQSGRFKNPMYLYNVSMFPKGK